MENYSEHIDALIAASLNGEAGAEEIRELDSWKSASSENLAYFEQMRILFSSSVPIDENVYDTDAAWNKVKARMNGANDTKLRSLNSNSRHQDFWSWMRIAAILVVSFGGMYWMYQSNKMKTPIIVQANKNAIEDSLPDGSTFYLKENSMLSYTKGYGNKERHLKLIGEAYFKVLHNSDVPFIIDAGLVMIKDVGTAFTVSAPADSDFVEVMVEEGEVYFYKTSGDGIHLLKGDHARFETSTGKITKLEPVSVNRTAYRTGILDFENMKLEDAVSVIEEVYHVNVDLGDSIRKCRLTASFKGEKLETVLDVISLTLNLQVKVEGSTIRIDGLSCGH